MSMKNSSDSIGNRTRARNMAPICEMFVGADNCCVRHVYRYFMLDIQVWGYLFVTCSYSRKLDSWTLVPETVLVYTEVNVTVSFVRSVNWKSGSSGVQSCCRLKNDRFRLGIVTCN